MDREEWQIHMDLAERCVAEGLAQIEKQQRLIRELEGNGGDTTRVRAFLATLLESQGRYEQHRDRLQQEVALQSKEAPAPLLNEESPELARRVTDDSQEDRHEHASDQHPAVALEQRRGSGVSESGGQAPAPSMGFTEAGASMPSGGSSAQQDAERPEHQHDRDADGQELDATLDVRS